MSVGIWLQLELAKNIEMTESYVLAPHRFSQKITILSESNLQKCHSWAKYLLKSENSNFPTNYVCRDLIAIGIS